MPVTPSYRQWLEEQLGRVEPLTSRAMFGGVGFYARGLFFALADDDLLYFKVDDVNRPDYEAAGMSPFNPSGAQEGTFSYFRVPDHVLEEPEELARWMEGAVAAALRKRDAKGSRRKR